MADSHSHNPDRKLPRTAKEIFNEARHLPPQGRAGFLDLACKGDVALRREVEALLSDLEAAGSFMESPTVAPPGDGGSGEADEAGETGPGSSRGDRRSGGTPTFSNGKPDEAPGALIGRYKLLQLIGEGGFGRVYMAEQTEPVVRRVALKVIKLGMDTRQVIARFEAERQALAMMDHPNIAHVLDAGATPEGRSYFVMELVRGDPITDYCDRNNLSVAERLDLFTHVCRAVQHAHQKGIIHRDIKPSNILITIADGRPVPKIIDFGIAKATHAGARLTEKTLFTEFRQLVGTPQYMSPEQAEASGVDIDTRSDIYSLGVLLYELLTGTTPFDPERLRSAAFGEIQRIIREEEPPKPSTRLSTMATLPSVAQHRRMEPRRLSTVVRGDLDWIVMKTLEKDRTRRYETADALAMDIQRHLNHEPVQAGPPGAAYKAAKFVRRHKVGVAASAAVAATLVLGIVGTSWGMAWALRERAAAVEARQAESEQRRIAEENERLAREEAARAEREAERALAAEAAERERADELDKVADFQASQLSGIDVPMMGVRLRSTLLERRRGVLEARRLEEPEIEAGLRELEEALGGINFTNVALEALDENIFERALKAIDEQFADQPLLRARLLQTVATTALRLGLLQRAVEPQTMALELRRRLLGNENAQTLASLLNMGRLLRVRGEFDQAASLLHEALEAYRRVFGDNDARTLTVINVMGQLYDRQGRLDEAEALYRKALEGRLQNEGAAHPDTLTPRLNLAHLLLKKGAYDESEVHMVAAWDAAASLYPADSPRRINFLEGMGTLRMQQGRFEEALASYGEALAIRRHTLGHEHPFTLALTGSMGTLLSRQGRYQEAEAYHRAALDGKTRVLGGEHPETLASLKNFGSVLHRQGHLEEAMIHLRKALDGFRRSVGDEHPRTAGALQSIAGLLRQQGEFDEAEHHLREALRLTSVGDNATALGMANDLGLLRMRQRRYDDSAALFKEALSIALRTLGDHPLTAALEHHYADVLRIVGRLDEAIELAESAVSRYRMHADWSESEAVHALYVLANAYLVAGRSADVAEIAAQLLADTSDGLRQRPRALADHLARAVTLVLASGDTRFLDEIEVAARQSLEIRQDLFPDDHPQVWFRHNAASLLAGVLLARAETAMDPQHALVILHEAEALLAPACEWMLSDPRMPSAQQTEGFDRTAESLERVIRLYELRARLEPEVTHADQAEVWRRRAADVSAP